MINLSNIIETRNGGDYQRDNFDDFLKKIRFSFNVPSIHIGGTNGKGSVASYLASIYKEAGYKVGLFTSPELYEINEMIKIDNININNDELKSIILDKKKEILKYDLSSFEILTYVALTYFEKEKCDICVIECGMGGELDATNIFIPILSIVTSISLEHTNYLGKSISEVALSKAGIIKEDIPVLIGELPEDAKTVISEVAKENSSKIFEVGESHQPTLTNEGYKFSYGTHYDLSIKSIAYYSVLDACIALDAIDILANRFSVKEDDILKGLSNVNMSCRMERLENDKLTIIDGGHNPEAFEKLANSLQKANYTEKIHVLLASFKDKNIIQMLSIIGSVTDTITLTTFPHVRARNEEDYFLFADDYEFIYDPIDGYKKLKELYPEDIILITGSLAFAAYMKKRLS